MECGEIKMTAEERIAKLEADFAALSSNILNHINQQQAAISSRRGPEGGRGQAGPSGASGRDGKDAVIKIVQSDGRVQIISEGRVQAEIVPVSGKDGRDGKDGIPGRDGSTPPKPADGAPGRDGKDGIAGRDGKDGKDAPSLSDVVNAVVDKMKAHWVKF
jgi:hypothetical protein